MTEEKNKYDFKEVEKKWRDFWEEHPEIYQADGAGNGLKPFRTKKYILVEFPYPSGSGLHIGHAFSFTGGDVYARFKRMQGYNVMFPMGWDAFGLPTENYAIKMKRKPQEVTKENTEMFKKQMKELAFSFDWSREINTTEADYYQWTQWIFIKLFEKGLAYKQEMPINWCPKCKIGLANEEVVNGNCERCGAETTRRNISQWVVKITDYADRLIEGLKDTDFIEKVKAAQINWINKSEGAKIKFQVVGNGLKPFCTKELEVFTTRPDTLYGATFMVVCPEHTLVADLINLPPTPSLTRGGEKSPLSKGDLEGLDIEAIEEYASNARKKSEMERAELNKEKTGVFSGLYAINPMTGKEIPIWISDFVLSSYGTGAIMAVPAHDERDFAFAKKFGLPIVPVIKPRGDHDFDKEPYVNVAEGKMVNSPEWEGLRPDEAIKKAIDYVENKGFGKRANSYHLRDWIFSRQHYWGEPIPIVACDKCGEVAVSEADLPIRLPEVEAYEPTETGESPLAKMTEWVKTKCPKCGGPAKRETDTMPNWAGSDWYYVRYIDPKNRDKIADMAKMKYWLPVDVYIGGDEHNTLHLLYSRFVYQFLYDIGAVPTPEPYYRRISHGVILGPDNQRMSKSRGNVIVPEDVTKTYGVDVMRMYLMFMGPFDGTMVWNEKTLMGVKRFLDKFYRFVLGRNRPLACSDKEEESSAEVKRIINKTVAGVTKDLEEFGYNTAIAKMMECMNKLSITNYELRIDELKILIKLLAPLAPYMAEELWAMINVGNKNFCSVHTEDWPVADKKYLVDEEITIPVAINGKVRGELKIGGTGDRAVSCPYDDEEEILKMAKDLPKIKELIGEKEIKKEIYVPGKMVNLVVV